MPSQRAPPAVNACACTIGGRKRRRDGQPNILFVLVDDLGWSDLGCYGSRTYETPHVDRLAQQGMRFSDCYAAGPVCSPTRASILTGKYPARTGITTYLLSPKRDPPNVAHHLALDEFTIADAFQKHGYATGYFGKWHLGYAKAHWAAEQGFRDGDRRDGSSLGVADRAP